MRSRTNRALRGAIGWKVRLDREPLTLITVVNVVPSVLMSIANAPVFHPVSSPPRPACLITKLPTVWAEPRSTCRLAPAVPEHHLLLLASTPSTALAAPSVVAHAVDAVTARPSARLVPSAGAGVGGSAPAVKLGGTSPAPVPQVLGLSSIV